MKLQEKYSTPVSRSYGPRHDRITAEREAWREMINQFVTQLPLHRPVPAARRIRVGGR